MASQAKLPVSFQLAVWLWASSLIFLCLGFLICKTGLVVVATLEACWGVRWVPLSAWNGIWSLLSPQECRPLQWVDYRARSGRWNSSSIFSGFNLFTFPTWLGNGKPGPWGHVCLSRLYGLYTTCSCPVCACQPAQLALSVCSFTNLGQVRYCRPFNRESVLWDWLGEGLRSRKCPVGKGHTMVLKMRCPFSGIASGKEGCG